MRTLWSRGAAFTVRRPQRWAPLLLACALTAAPVRAQTHDTSPPTHSATLWLTDDGLPAGDVLAMAQDRDGYLWLGMNTGLVRFDGHQFLPWGARGESPLPGNRIDAVFASRDGSLWLGYGDHDGVTRVHEGRVDTYAGGRDGLVGGSVSALLEDRAGLLWLGSSEGLSAFRAGGWEDLGRTLGAPQTEVFSLYEDRRGTIWAGTAAGVYRRTRDHEAFSLVDAASNFVQSFVEDDAGTIWVTDSQRIMRPLAGALPRYADRVRLPTAGWRLLRAHDGTVWIAALGGGLLRVDPTRSGRVALIERAGHEEKIVGSPRSLFQDRHDNIWMGMRGGGLVRLAETVFRTDIPLEGLTNDGVRGLAAVGDEVWVATGHDLNAIGPRGRRVFNIAQTLALHVDRTGALWASTASGVGRVTNGQLDMLDLAPGIRIERVVSIATDFDGRLWLCSIDQGLLSSNGGIVTPYTGEPTIAGKPCNFVYTDRSGRLWIAFPRMGIATYEAGRFDVHDEAEGAPPGSVIAITQDAPGAIWFNTASSLSRFHDGVFTTIGSRNGLPDKIVPSIIDDEQGYLWVGVSSGSEIVRLHRREVDAVASNHAHQIKYARYGLADGLQGELHFQSRPGAVRSRDGRLWFVTGRGVAVIDPRSPVASRESTLLRIERVAVGGRPLPLTASPADALPNRSSIEIDYAIPSLSAGAKLRFRHLLEGLDTGWSDAGVRRSASYASLPAGSYRFRVAATGVDAGSDTEAVWSFVIAPPFYQRAWFYGAGTAFVALAFWGYWQLRLRAVRRQFAVVVAERTRVSREIHDTLLQSLGAVGLELEVVARGLDGALPASSEALRRLRGKVRNCISEARESIWELRTLAPVNRSLLDALRELAEDATSPDAVEVTVAVNGRPRDVGQDVAHHLLRIAQEATNNAIRHGHARHVTIDLDCHGHSLTLRVRDDGCGFSSETQVTDSTRDRWGLVNIRERAERVGGTLSLVSFPGKGTVVEVAVPLG